MTAIALHIRPARPREGERLRDILIEAKCHWGHDRARVVEWAEREDFSAPALQRQEIYVAEAGARVVAWSSLIPKGETCWLDDLWVDPPWMGSGVGSRLFRHAADLARQRGAARMEWEAEPSSVGFYEKMGGWFVRDSQPTEWGRIIPVMALDLTGRRPAPDTEP